jgi:hypothetical protein
MDFLRVDLELAFTLLEAAGLDPSYRDGNGSGIPKVREVLAAVRRLENRVVDPQACRDLLQRADELESALAAF